MPTILLSVLASEDDAWQAGDGYIQINGEDVQIFSDPTPSSAFYKSGGLRFQSVPIPTGVTITSAKLRLLTTYSVDLNCTIYGHAVDNALNFVDQPIINTRPRTVASVPWVQDALPPMTQIERIGLEAIIQEIVNRSGWVSGNSLALLLIANNDVAKQFRAWAFDNPNNPAWAAQLEIVYTGGGGIYHTVTVQSIPISVPVTVDGSPMGNTPIALSLTEESHNISVPSQVSV